MKILMVCLGNICRSPLAEGILQQKAREAGLNWTVDSAGTENYHIGSAPHPLSQKVAILNGINIGEQKARRFTKEDLQHFDRIYAMGTDILKEMKTIAGHQWQPEKVELLLNELEPGSNQSVPDPWYGPEPGYHEVYELLDRACTAVIEKYA